MSGVMLGLSALGIKCKKSAFFLIIFEEITFERVTDLEVVGGLSSINIGAYSG